MNNNCLDNWILQCFFRSYCPLVQCYKCQKCYKYSLFRYVFWSIHGLKRMSWHVIVYLCYTTN